MLKLLIHKSKVDKEAVAKTIDELCPAAITKAMLEFIGLTIMEYKEINPNAEMFKNNEQVAGNGKPVYPVNVVKPKELLHYLNPEGDGILYPDLISDEIARVDENLLKASKKEGQVGGMNIFHPDRMLTLPKHRTTGLTPPAKH